MRIVLMKNEPYVMTSDGFDRFYDDIFSTVASEPFSGNVFRGRPVNIKQMAIGELMKKKYVVKRTPRDGAQV